MDNKKNFKNISGFFAFAIGILAFFLVYSLVEFKGISLLYPIMIFFIVGVIVGAISFRFRLEMNMASDSKEKKEWEILYVITSLTFAVCMIGFIILSIIGISNN